VIDTTTFLAQYDRHVRQGPAEHGIERQAGSHVIRHIPNDEHDCWIVWSDLAGTNADDVIRQERQHFLDMGRLVEWKVFGHDAPADLADRLRSAGFTEEEHEALLAIDLDAAASLTAPGDSEGEVRISDVSDIDRIVNVYKGIWPDHADELGRRFELGMTGDTPGVLVHAELEGAIVGAAWMNFRPGAQMAELWAGAVIEEARHRGFYRHMTHLRLETARERGMRYATVDAGPQSRPILERMGFTYITSIVPCIFDPARSTLAP
jgi:GNAT superfamily N-acetyltransferase